jgi:hypothetical protein
VIFDMKEAAVVSLARAMSLPLDPIRSREAIRIVYNCVLYFG